MPMADTMLDQAAKLGKTKRRKKTWRSIVLAMAAVVVFCTTYALILPAITMEAETFCGVEEHVHGDDCYTVELIPQKVTFTCEGLICGHVHSELCRDGDGELICPLPERVPHVHGDECFTENTVLTCSLAETFHVHTETCYALVESLVCTEEHEHLPECYVSESRLVCALAEDPEGHLHGEECFVTERFLSCGTDEFSLHAHGETCFDENGALICGLEGVADHVHTQECLLTEPEREEKTLVCQLAEHSHSLSCYSDPMADIESSAVWEASMDNVELSGIWETDVRAIAMSQLGYTESEKNYFVCEDGETVRGYTRYGAWYGDHYGDWCAMFVSFCYDYAGVVDFPLEASCPRWVEKLSEVGLYVPAASHSPETGDVIFFDWDGDGLANHVGLVAEVSDATDTEPARVKTVEGNSSDRVACNTYDLSDGSILGYGELEQPDFISMFSSINEGGEKLYHHPEFLEYRYSSHRVNDHMTLCYVLIPYDQRDTWEPGIKDWTATTNTNYVVAYCADRDTDINTSGEVYTALRIQDSDYKAAGETLSGIIGHAYPFISAEDMADELARAYSAGEIAFDLSCCTESEFIAAAQWAVWDATGLSGVQDTASGSTFPEYNNALAPLDNVGHTEAELIQSHVKAIRDWLMTRTAPMDISVADSYSEITSNGDGTFDVFVRVDLDRPIAPKEELSAVFTAGDRIVPVTVGAEGTQSFEFTVTGLSEAEVLDAGVDIAVSFTHMQVYVYDSESYQDMISGQWGTEGYTIGFDINAETASVAVKKHWADEVPGAEGVSVQLFADGIAHGDAVILSEANSWEHTWEGLIKYSSPGVETVYTVSEVPVEGYYSEIELTTGKTLDISLTTATGFEEGGVYTLAYSGDGGEKLLCDVSALGAEGLDWISAAAPEELPDYARWVASSVTDNGVRAVLQNAATGNYLTFDGGYIVLSSSPGELFFNQNRFYGADETYYNHYLVYLDGGRGYTVENWDDGLSVDLARYSEVELEPADITFLITNTRSTETTSVSVNKVWEGRPDGTYPESVEVSLIQNGEPYGVPVLLSEENGWHFLCEELPLRVGGETFEYSVRETKVQDYSADLSVSTDENGTTCFTLKNTWTPEYVVLELTKRDFADPETLLSGAGFELYLKVDAGTENAVYVPGTVDGYGILWAEFTTDENGSFTVENLPVCESFYLIETVAPEGYNMIFEVMEFALEKDENGQKYLSVISGATWLIAPGQGENGEQELMVLNDKIYVLPATGGKGGMLFTVAGAVLMTAAAGTMLFIGIRRRYRNNKA